ncbi:polysialyltransferase family glycosyltransferase [Brevibacterium salitolerans]|uniref:Alpha-2,8-polysialyltransferase family protein n=1 Tax=Brevibacterium salitolerans TaxID=1403566 RepID=A0ABN2X573_9MICO
MKQVFAVSSWLQLASLAAAMDSGLLEEAQERVLLVSDNRVVNEVGPSFAQRPEAAPLLTRFDRVISLNEWIWPMHPAQWGPKDIERTMWSKLFTRAWELESADGRVQLFLESVQSNPGRALAAVFLEAELFVHSDGLMGYGPTRNRLSPLLWNRLRGFVYVDLVPGLRPLMLSEFERVEHLVVPPEAVRAAIGEVADSAAVQLPEEREGTALIIGQYLSDIDLLTHEQETEVYAAMVRSALDAGCTSVVFKPHPAASSSVSSVLAARAAEAGAAFELAPSSVPLELCLDRMRPAAVYSCFSTGMVTAWRLYGAKARSLGTDLALEAFAPYENSNRIPVTICRYLFDDAHGAEAAHTSESTHSAEAAHGPEAAHGGAQGGAYGDRAFSLQELTDAVGYCMQSRIYPHLRDSAQAFLTAHYSAAPEYFKRRRLTKLGLPGGLPPRTRTVLDRARSTVAQTLPEPVAARVRPLAAKVRSVLNARVPRAAAPAPASPTVAPSVPAPAPAPTAAPSSRTAASLIPTATGTGSRR